ncbi:IPT/TIG domain-containing protein [Pseudomonadales bacterium]|nr:IPT/TIG domain-containing protein [Pseudomonadales bacterium]
MGSSNTGASFFYSIGGTACPALVPEVLSVDPPIVNQNVTIDVLVNGNNFTPSTTVDITGQTVNSVTFVNSSQLSVNITTGTTDGLYNVTVSDCAGDGVLADGFEVELSVWVDLRLGGDAFTDGNAAGNDIRYRNGMSLTRDASGMFFAGINPWGSWVKFESLGWTRGTNKTLQWIFTGPDNPMMIGIGSDATNETSNSQWNQAEVLVYFNNGTNFWGLYGNNGNVGSTGNQAIGVAIPAASAFKIKFEDDGDAGDIFTLYQLPSASPVDWDDETNIITSFAIGGTLNPDEMNIMPFIIPRSGGNQRFIALKVD